MADYEQIRKELRELRSDLRRRHFELQGVDRAALEKLEGDLSKGHDGIMKALTREARREGAETAKRQRQSLRFARRIIEHDRRIFESNVGLNQFVGLLHACLSPTVVTPIDSGFEVTLEDPGEGQIDAATEFDTDEGPARTLVGAHSFSGQSSSVEMEVWFKFSFRPEADGVYCITPVIQMSGMGVLLVGLGCGDDPWSAGGWASAKVRVEVDQLSARVAERWVSPAPFDQSAIVSQDLAEAFEYDSTVQNNAGLEAPLFGGRDAVVTVRCILFASSTEGGRSRVDMKNSSHFYFSVPELSWGAPRNWFFSP